MPSVELPGMDKNFGNTEGGFYVSILEVKVSHRAGGDGNATAV